MAMDHSAGEKRTDFIRDIIDEDLRRGKHSGVVTRFPPEPNGYLHIGHAKSICLNFGLAAQYGGRCHLRMDDTDPTKESMEYVEAIRRDVRWLGFDWGDDLFFASDYFERLYEHALQLIRDGKAYVDSLSDDEIKEYRGTISESGRPSPYRERTAEENLDLFHRMRAGEFRDGSHVLRARIDLGAANMKMRDPPIYRIRHVEHYRRGTEWCIFPLYDFTHCLSDAIEHITHSICTLEFENNRELYDWVLDNTDVECRPQQIEFARLNLNYTVLSKRKLIRLVEERHVAGWDDPRMPTIAGLRRRGVTPEAIRSFCNRIGVAKNNSTVDLALLEHTIREDLNRRAPRVLCVLRPLKVVIADYPAGKVEEIDAPHFPADIGRPGSRKLPFTREILIEQDDFAEHPPKGWHRLSPGEEVRLRHAYVIRCVSVVKDEKGRVRELRCTHDPATKGGPPPDGRRIRGTIHWVSAERSLEVEVRLYDRLFKDEDPNRCDDFTEFLNPSSLETLPVARAEPSLRCARTGDRYQFERLGFFVVDDDSTDSSLVFNRTVALRDSWAKSARRSRAVQSGTSGRRRGSSRAELPGKSARELGDDARSIVDAYGLTEDEASRIAGNVTLKRLFEAAVERHPNAKAIASLLVSEIRRMLKDTTRDPPRFDGTDLGELIELVDSGVISGRVAKDVLARMALEGDSPTALVDRLAVRQISDVAELEPVVARVVASDPGAVERYRAGNARVLGGLVGQVMRETGGKANPSIVNDLVKKALAE